MKGLLPLEWAISSGELPLSVFDVTHFSTLASTFLSARTRSGTLTSLTRKLRKLPRSGLRFNREQISGLVLRSHTYMHERLSTIFRPSCQSVKHAIAL
jgi:hypothetical protein